MSTFIIFICFTILNKAYSLENTTNINKRQNKLELIGDILEEVARYTNVYFEISDQLKNPENKEIFIRNQLLDKDELNQTKKTKIILRGGLDVGLGAIKDPSGLLDQSGISKGSKFKAMSLLAFKAAFEIIFAVGMPFLDRFFELGVDCAQHYLIYEIIKQVSPSMDLIKEVIYPLLDLIDDLKKQQLMEEAKYKETMAGIFFTNPTRDQREFVITEPFSRNYGKHLYWPLLAKFNSIN